MYPGSLCSSHHQPGKRGRSQDVFRELEASAVAGQAANKGQNFVRLTHPDPMTPHPTPENLCQRNSQ